MSDDDYRARIMSQIIAAKAERGLSLDKIRELTEANGEGLALSTIGNVFAAKGARCKIATLRIIARALGVPTDNEDYDALVMEVQHLKTLLEAADERVDEQSKQISSMRQQIKHSRIWLTLAAVALVVILSAALAAFVVDKYSPTMGWFQR